MNEMYPFASGLAREVYRSIAHLLKEDQKAQVHEYLLRMSLEWFDRYRHNIPRKPFPPSRN